MNIRELQKQVYKNTIDLGYSIDKKSTLKKLKEEFKEFKKAKPVPDFVPINIDVDCNHEFMRGFLSFEKDTEHDEIPDIIFVLLSYCEENNIDAETLIKNKLRYNRLRGVK